MLSAAHGPQHSHEHNDNDLHCVASRQAKPVAYRQKEQSRLLWCIVITFVAMLIEAVGGWWTGSLALLSDAGHMFSHLFSLLISYVAIMIATKKPDAIRSFGFYRAEILAALLNGVTLVLIVFGIGYAAFNRFIHPEPIATTEMMWIAIFGLVVNLTTAFILKNVSQNDLNVKSAFLHMLGDTLSSVGVVGAAVVISYTGAVWLDPALSIFIALLIAIWSVQLLKDAVHILLESTPQHIDQEKIKEYIQSNIAAVHDVHHLHVWELTSHVCSMTAHVVIDNVSIAESEIIRRDINHLLKKEFHISHTNLQFECKKEVS